MSNMNDDANNNIKGSVKSLSKRHSKTLSKSRTKTLSQSHNKTVSKRRSKSLSNSSAKNTLAKSKGEKVVLKNTTPEFNRSVARELDDSIKPQDKQLEKTKNKDFDLSPESLALYELIRISYSPQVNKLLDSLQSLSENPATFSCENNQQIKIKKGSKVECVDWESKEAQNAMLHNLKRKHINFSNVVAPANIDKNGWFNVYFMAFFISDKGRLFFRFFRQIMITGKMISEDSKPIKPELRWPLFLLNYYIESSILGKGDPENFASQMNTNTLVREIGGALSKIYSTHAFNTETTSNPLNLYMAFTKFLGNQVMFKPVRPSALKESHMVKHIGHGIRSGSGFAELLAVFVDPGKKKKDMQKRYTYTDKDFGNFTYALDSIIMLSKDKTQWAALITGNKKGYAFDGNSFSRLTPYEWKNKINSSEEFTFEGSSKTYSLSPTSTYIMLYYLL